MTLNERSRKALAGVHPDLVRVVEAAAERCPVPIVVTEGLRTLERQKELKAAGKSWTLNGRHLTGHAVDLVDADNYGYDIPDLDKIAQAMKEVATELEIPIVWGGDWKTRDTPHFELCRKAYPASGVSVATQITEAAGNVARARGVIATAAGSAAVLAQQITQTGVPAVPDVATKSLENIGAWKTIAKSVLALGREGMGVVEGIGGGLGRLWPFVVVAGAAGAVLAWLIGRRA